ncbi:MAG: HD domain-containing protein [Candidatus Bipolaricaulota bacterium]|nr:HD domain-containing protein [Candidatus Bipolaricaulota bacterium]
MTDELRELLPEVDWIEDADLRAGVLAAYARALAEGGWVPADLNRIPFTLLKASGVSYVEHVRAVTRIARAACDTFQEVFGDRVPLNRDVLLAGALLHDVGKLVEVEEVEGKFRKSRSGKALRHPFSGAALAYAAGLPPEVVHIIAVHSKEGDPYPRSPEGAVVHHADFITFDAIP